MINIIKITDYMSEELISLNLKARTKNEVLLELSKLMETSPNISIVGNNVYKSLVEREKLGSTGIGKGVAIPHAKTESAKSLTIAFGVSKERIDFKSMDNEGVNIFFVFASPIKDSQIYLKVLARISRLIREESFRQGLLGCKTPNEVIEYINKKETV